MPRVAIVTDSATDLPVETAAAHDITVVPLVVSFGQESFRSGVEISLEAFYERLTAPGAPFPTTAACAPSAFVEAFRARLDAGAEEVVCITIGSRLSATYDSARQAIEQMAGAPVRLVDSATASMSSGMVVLAAAEVAAAGGDGAAVVAAAEDARSRSRLYVGLETLEYLRRGGRISAAQAAIGTVLSVKPIITIEGGLVETADRPRTATKARARLLELLSERPVERAWVLHTRASGVEVLADELAERLGLRREDVGISLIGPVVAPHVGPGAYGATVLLAAGGVADPASRPRAS